MTLDDYLEAMRTVKTLEPEEEKELWQAAKARGNSSARRRIIEAYQPLVFKTALPYRGNSDKIMDIVQEGTVGLIEAFETYDYRRGVAFSLFAVHRIRGRMLDYLRREGKNDVPCTLAGDCRLLYDEQAPLVPSVDEVVERHEAASRVRSALLRLPQKERAVLEGVYLKSEDVKDVAAELNVSTNYIYRLQKSGVRRIRGMLSRFMQHWK